MMGIGAPPSLIEYNNMKFVITEKPEPSCIHPYIQQLMRFNTRKLLKVCEGYYDFSLFCMVGIDVEELLLTDGAFPTSQDIDTWLKIVEGHFKEHPKSALAVHCRSGLGRSAVLVTIALMEAGLKPQEAIDFVRSRRRGCFNAYQLQELENYKPQFKLCTNNPSRHYSCFSRKSRTERKTHVIKQKQ